MMSVEGDVPMTILLGFAPFLVFIVLERTVGFELGLRGAAATALLLLLRDVVMRHRRPKVLELGTFILFCLLAIYGALLGAQWSFAKVRLSVDGGLLLIVLLSMAIRQPFTLQYARESVPAEIWAQPRFIRTNYIITAAWAAAFAAMVAVDLAWVVSPDLSPTIVILVTVAAVLAAAYFTSWYPAGSAPPR
jgi:hypothetical protein